MKEFTVYGMRTIRQCFVMKIEANTPLDAESIARHDICKNKSNPVESSEDIVVVSQPTAQANGGVR